LLAWNTSFARYQYIKKEEEEEGKEFLDNSDPAVV
jgi:hypothetical protein